jgi:hypothetical protein
VRRLEMENGLPQKFDLDPYLERLLQLRKTDPVAYNMYHPEVKKVVEDYEREKKAAESAERNSAGEK